MTTLLLPTGERVSTTDGPACFWVRSILMQVLCIEVAPWRELLAPEVK
ncbi:hypothetical protein ABZ319_18950 [Nocardia sp. NPDC005978]